MTLDLHLEVVVTDDQPEWVWWAESPDLPGFSAAADTLRDLRTRAEDAVREILGSPDVEFSFRILPVESAVGPVEEEGEEASEPEQRTETVSRVAPLREPAAV